MSGRILKRFCRPILTARLSRCSRRFPLRREHDQRRQRWSDNERARVQLRIRQRNQIRIKSGALDFFFPLIANKIVTREERQNKQSQDDGDSQKILPAFGDRRLAGSVKLRPGKRCRWRTRFRRSAPVFVERSSRRKDSTRRKKDLGSDKNRESHKKIAVHPSRLNPPALPQPPGPA